MLAALPVEWEEQRRVPAVTDSDHPKLTRLHAPAAGWRSLARCFGQAAPHDSQGPRARCYPIHLGVHCIRVSCVT